jgi:hypothetical protein
MYGNAKTIPIDTIPGMGGKGDKGEWWRGWMQSMIYLIHCKNLCKCHSVPPPSTIVKEEKKKVVWMIGRTVSISAVWETLIMKRNSMELSLHSTYPINDQYPGYLSSSHCPVIRK